MEIRSKRYPVRVQGVDFDVHGSQEVAKVKKIIESLDGRTIERAGNAYVNAGGMLAETLKVIEDAAFEMAKVWADKPSTEAQQALRAIYVTIKNLSGSCNEVGRQLESLGRTVIPAYRDYGGIFSWADDFSLDDNIPDIWINTKFGGSWFSSDKDGATEHLKYFNKELKIIHDLLPATVREDLPEISAPGVPPPDMKSPTPAPTISTFNKPYTGPSLLPGIDNGGTGYTPSDSGTGPDGTVPGSAGSDDAEPGGNGSGSSHPPDTGDGRPPAAPLPSGNGFNPSSIPDVLITTGVNTPDAGTTRLSDHQPPKIDNSANPPIDTKTGLPTSIGLGPGDGVSIGAGPRAGAERGGLSRSVDLTPDRLLGPQGTAGMPMMPMTGMGGQEERQKDHSTWLVEEEDVWGSADDTVVAHTLGET